MPKTFSNENVMNVKFVRRKRRDSSKYTEEEYPNGIDQWVSKYAHGEYWLRYSLKNFWYDFNRRSDDFDRKDERD